MADNSLTQDYGMAHGSWLMIYVSHTCTQHVGPLHVSWPPPYSLLTVVTTTATARAGRLPADVAGFPAILSSLSNSE